MGGNKFQIIFFKFLFQRQSIENYLEQHPKFQPVSTARSWKKKLVRGQMEKKDSTSNIVCTCGKNQLMISLAVESFLDD